MVIVKIDEHHLVHTSTSNSKSLMNAVFFTPASSEENTWKFGRHGRAQSRILHSYVHKALLRKRKLRQGNDIATSPADSTP